MEVKSARADLWCLQTEHDSILLNFKTNFFSWFLSPQEKSTVCIPEVLWCQRFAGREHVYKLSSVSFLCFAQAMDRYIFAWQLFISLLSYPTVIQSKVFQEINMRASSCAYYLNSTEYIRLLNSLIITTEWKDGRFPSSSHTCNYFSIFFQTFQIYLLQEPNYLPEHIHSSTDFSNAVWRDNVPIPVLSNTLQCIFISLRSSSYVLPAGQSFYLDDIF